MSFLTRHEVGPSVDTFLVLVLSFNCCKLYFYFFQNVGIDKGDIPDLAKVRELSDFSVFEVCLVITCHIAHAYSQDMCLRAPDKVKI